MRRMTIARTLASIAVFAGLGIAGGACRTVGQPGTATPGVSDTLGGGGHPTTENRLDLGGATSARPNASGAVASSSSASATASNAPPRWGAVPEREGQSGGFYTIVDGACGPTTVSLFQNEAIAIFGNALARVTDDGLVVDPTMNRGYSGGGYEAVGRWPETAYLLYDNGSRCTSSVRAKHFQNGKWEEAFALPEYQSVRNVAIFGNGAIGLRDCNWSCSSSENTDCGQGMYIGDNAKAPPIAGDGFRTTSYQILESGEVFAVGVICPKQNPDNTSCVGQFRWWSPGTKVGYAPLGGGLGDPNSNAGSVGWLLVKSKTEVYVSQGSYFGSFDGTKLKKLPSPTKGSTYRLFDAKANGIWVEAEDKLFERKPDGTFTDVTPPTFFKLAQLSGVELGAPWYLGTEHVRTWSYSGRPGLYKRVSGAWQKVDLPAPARASSAKSYLTATQLAVRAPDDVFVVAVYSEMPNGWNEAERRRVVLRTKRPKETLRCGGPTSIEGWPPPAGDSCTTPFVVFAEVSASSPKDYDYPQTRGVLRGKGSLVVDGSLSEIRENGKLWIGAQPKSVADGRKLVEIYAKNWQYSRPEVLCATPNVARKVPIEK